MDCDLVIIIIISWFSPSLKKASLTWSLICIKSSVLIKSFGVWRINLFSLYTLFFIGFSAGFFWTVIGLPTWSVYLLISWLAYFLVITICGVGRFFDATSAYVCIFFRDIILSIWFIFYTIFALISVICFWSKAICILVSWLDSTFSCNFRLIDFFIFF